MLRQPHRQRPRAAQREVDVVGPGADAEQADGFLHHRPGLRIGRDGAEHDVGMAADIFGGGLHADVDAEFERAVKQRRRPGVVVDHQRTARMRDLRDGGDVGHFEGLRTGRLDQHRPGVRLEQLLDAAADLRIEIAGLDAVARQQPVAEVAGGAIDVVADQQMIARLGHRQQGGGDRGEPRGRNADAGALRAFQPHHHILQRPRGRRAVAAIGVFGAVGVQVLGGRIEHGRAVEHGRIDKPLLRLGVAAGGDQPGFSLLRCRFPRPRKFSCICTKDFLSQPQRDA